MQHTLKRLSALYILVFFLSGCELSPDVVICKEGTPPVLGTPATIQEIPTKLGPSTQLFTYDPCLLYTSPSPRDRQKSRMPSSA